MRVLRLRDYRSMPWKNGGGETLEIAVTPPGAALDDFSWRLSMARVASDGPFSRFDGVDRTLSIVEGAGLDLTIDGKPPLRLQRDSPPCAFAGESETSARRLAGTATDLNVMTRRARFRHVVRRRRFVGSEELAVRATVTALFVVEGALACASDAGIGWLTAFDTALWQGAAGRVRLESETAAEYLWIELEGG